MYYSKYDQWFVFDEPIPYRPNGTSEDHKPLKIYPITMKDYLMFQAVIRILLIEKNYINDPEIIRMSFLEFLFKKSNEENNYVTTLWFLLHLCFKIDNKDDLIFGYDDKKKPIIKILGETLNSQDFDDLRLIICEQNMIKLPNDNISKEAKDAFEKAKEYKQKLSGTKMAPLEDQIICIMISTNLTLEDIKNLTIRKFMKILERADLKLHYQIYLSASMSGMVTFKDTSFIKHWMSEMNEVDEYADVKIGMDKVKDKLR